MTHVSVAIVGAGPVGLTTAALLGEYGIDCVVLEKQSDVCSHPRAQTIDDESLRTLQVLGLATPFLQTTVEAQGSRYYDSDGNCYATIGPGPRNYGFAKRNYMLQQNLDRLLLTKLQNHTKTQVRFDCEVTGVHQNDEAVTLTINNQESLMADYVLACDGGQSRIRHWLGVTLKGWTYRQDWIVLDVQNDPDTHAVSRFFCDPRRPGVSIASPNQGRRFEFMVMPGETTERVLADEFIRTLLEPHRPFSPTDIVRRAVYTFHARIASELRCERILFLGDAAHVTPPFAGQGMNAGMRDAHNVAWKLALVINEHAASTILDSYNDERREPIWAMIQLAVVMGEFVMPVTDEQIHLTGSLMRSLEQFPQVRDWLFQMKFKPKPRYDQGLFIDLDDQPYEASLVGEMLTQPPIQLNNGDAGLLDDVLGSGFSLIAQNDEGERALGASDHSLWRQLNTRRVRLIDPRTEPTSRRSEGFRAIASPYYRPLRTHRDQILLVRPDRYVAAACAPPALDALADRMTDLLHHY